MKRIPTRIDFPSIQDAFGEKFDQAEKSQISNKLYEDTFLFREFCRQPSRERGS